MNLDEEEKVGDGDHAWMDEREVHSGHESDRVLGHVEQHQESDDHETGEDRGRILQVCTMGTWHTHFLRAIHDDLKERI